MSIRILMVNKYAHVTGGADQNCLAVLDELRQRGHDVSILSTTSTSNVVDCGAFIEPTVTHQTRERLGPRARMEVLAYAMWNPAASRAMDALLAEFRPDVVHVHKLYPQLSVAPVVMAGRRGLPIVQTLHDYELLSASALDDTGGRVDRDESRLSYRAVNTATFALRRALHAPRVSAFVACSRFLAGRYREKLGIEATVLPYFIEFREPDAPAFSEREGAIFVGRLTEEKGVRDVLALAEAVPAVRIVVVGYGPLAGVVDAAQRRYENLAFVGRQERVSIRRLLTRARVFLMPSRWQEPGGIAALEAMAVGTPVIAYANGGLAEYVSDAGGGVAIEPSVRALAAHLPLLHDDGDRWSKHSRRGIEGIARLHSAERYISRLLEVYASVA